MLVLSCYVSLILLCLSYLLSCYVCLIFYLVMSVLSFILLCLSYLLSCYVRLILSCLSYLLSCYTVSLPLPPHISVHTILHFSTCTFAQIGGKGTAFFSFVQETWKLFLCRKFPVHCLSAMSPPSLHHASTISPPCLRHLSTMPPLSLRYASAVYYGKRTAKRRQKDGKRTAKGRNQKQREAGENPDSSPVSACFMLTTTISPPRLRIYNSTAAQHKSLLLSDTTKTAFVSNF